MNTYRLAAIGVKEGVAAGNTKIVGKDITNPILRMAYGISFKSVDDYQLHQLITTITQGAERPDATTVRHQFVKNAGMVFDWRDTVAINIKNFATNAAKTQMYGIWVHNDLKAVVIFGQHGMGSTPVMGYGNKRCPSFHQSKIQIQPQPRHKLHQIWS